MSQSDRKALSDRPTRDALILKTTSREVPLERLDHHSQVLPIDRESPQVERRGELAAEAHPLLEQPVVGDVEDRLVLDLDRVQRIDEVDIRPPQLVPEHPPASLAGQRRDPPAQVQVALNVKRLVARVDAGEVDQHEPHRDLERQLHVLRKPHLRETRDIIGHRPGAEHERQQPRETGGRPSSWPLHRFGRHDPARLLVLGLIVEKQRHHDRTEDAPATPRRDTESGDISPSTLVDAAGTLFRRCSARQLALTPEDLGEGHLPNNRTPGENAP